MMMGVQPLRAPVTRLAVRWASQLAASERVSDGAMRALSVGAVVSLLTTALCYCFSLQGSPVACLSAPSCLFPPLGQAVAKLGTSLSSLSGRAALLLRGALSAFRLEPVVP